MLDLDLDPPALARLVRRATLLRDHAIDALALIEPVAGELGIVGHGGERERPFEVQRLQPRAPLLEGSRAEVLDSQLEEIEEHVRSGGLEAQLLDTRARGMHAIEQRAEIRTFASDRQQLAVEGTIGEPGERFDDLGKVAREGPAVAALELDAPISDECEAPKAVPLGLVRVAAERKLARELCQHGLHRAECRSPLGRGQYNWPAQRASARAQNLLRPAAVALAPLCFRASFRRR